MNFKPHFFDNQRRRAVSWTLQQVKDACICAGIPEKYAEGYYNHYAPVGFLDGAQRPIVNITLHVPQKWDRANNCWVWDKNGNDKPMVNCRHYNCDKIVKAQGQDDTGQWYGFCKKHKRK